MTPQQVHTIFEKRKWTFAKSMPKFPHWYLHRDWFDDVEEFRDIVRFIRAHGTERAWFKQKYIYYEHEGYEYWTMGAAIEKTKIINKAKCKSKSNSYTRKKSVLSKMNANEQISRFLAGRTTSESKKKGS